MAVGKFDASGMRGELGLERGGKLCGALRDFFDGEANHSLRGNLVPGRAQVGTKSRFHRGDGELVHSQGAE